MKKLLLPLLLIAAISASAQQLAVVPAPTIELHLPNQGRGFSKQDLLWLHAGLLTSSGIKGIARTQQEVTTHNWLAYLYRHPNARPEWANPKVSTANKYLNGDPNQGPRFPLSTTLLVGVTDKYHLNQTIVTFMTMAQLTLVTTISMDDLFKKKKFRLRTPLLLSLEAIVAENLAKGLAHRYYDVY